MVRGASLGLLLTPITVASLSGLTGAEIAQGAGLTNLFRQLGGSFGIAAINTYIVKMTAFHRADLVADVSSGGPALLERQAALAHRLLAFGDSPADAQAAATGLVDRAVQNAGVRAGLQRCVPAHRHRVPARPARRAALPQRPHRGEGH